jgi:glycosyltransferase involved in cell wall biosynthesis
MTKLATLFLLSNLSIGGSERKTVRVVNALRRRGLDVHLGYLNGPETLRAEIDPVVPIVCLERHGKFSWAALRRLKAYVKTHEIARIVCVNLYPLLYASALRLAMGVKAPSYVVTVNTTYFLNSKEAISMLIYAPLMWKADKIVFGCKFQHRYWMNKYRLQNDKCDHLYNGVDENYYSSSTIEKSVGAMRHSLGLNENDFVVGTIGQLRTEKHHQDLISAVHRLRRQGIPATALIVGGGPEADALRKLAGELGIEAHIRLIGELQDVRPALLASDVFVLTSLSETFSNAALEAMAMGKPVVLSDTGGAREMVWEGINGYLFPATDVAKLASVLSTISGDVLAMQRMGEEARRVAVEKFSFTCMVDGYEKLVTL